MSRRRERTGDFGQDLPGWAVLEGGAARALFQRIEIFSTLRQAWPML